MIQIRSSIMACDRGSLARLKDPKVSGTGIYGMHAHVLEIGDSRGMWAHCMERNQPLRRLSQVCNVSGKSSTAQCNPTRSVTMSRVIQNSQRASWCVWIGSSLFQSRTDRCTSRVERECIIMIAL